MRKLFLFYAFLFCCQWLNAQSLKRPVASPYIGLSAYSINQADVFSFTSNQAALAGIKNISAGVFGERRFLLAATNMYSAVFALPTSKGNFGFRADYFGYENYNESQLGIAYARSLGEKLDIGVQFNYYSFRIPAYQSSAAVNFEIGVMAHLTEKINAGIQIHPATGTISKTDNEKLGSVYKFGIGYDAGENFNISAEIMKEEDMPVNVTAGVQYHFEKRFFARMGISSDSGSPFAGAGICWDNLRLDVSASYHPQLGISPGLMLIFKFKTDKVDNK